MTSNPVGWITAAGVGTGAVVFGGTRLLKKFRNDSIEEIPSYINTPLDVLAINLLKVIMPAMIYVAKADKIAHDAEAEAIIDYFVKEWGLARNFVNNQYAEIVQQSHKFTPDMWAKELAEIGNNKDINFAELCEDIFNSLVTVMNSDGEQHQSEIEAIETLKKALEGESHSLGLNISSMTSAINNGISTLTHVPLTKLSELIFASSNDQTDNGLEDDQTPNIPTIWLLGKTGAGKSTFVKNLTGYTNIPVGFGFKPCTTQLNEYLFPEENPLIRLLDTRGLGEINYDPTMDLDTIFSKSDLILVVAKLDEPNQSEVIDTLKFAYKRNVSQNLIVLHTEISNSDPTQIEQAYDASCKLFSQTWKGSIQQIRVNLNEASHAGHASITGALANVLPVVRLQIEQKKLDGAEAANLNAIHPSVLRYSIISGASGAVPLVSAVTVLSAQGMMLKSIAKHYEVEWSQRTLIQLFSALGSTFVLTQLASASGRSLISGIPIVGSAFSAVLAFATTYAIGRVACYYFFRRTNGIEVTSEELQEVYSTMFEKGKQSAHK